MMSALTSSLSSPPPDGHGQPLQSPDTQPPNPSMPRNNGSPFFSSGGPGSPSSISQTQQDPPSPNNPTETAPSPPNDHADDDDDLSGFESALETLGGALDSIGEQSNTSLLELDESSNAPPAEEPSGFVDSTYLFQFPNDSQPPPPSLPVQTHTSLHPQYPLPSSPIPQVASSPSLPPIPASRHPMFLWISSFHE